MRDPRGRSLAAQLLGFALAVFVAAWLIVRAVRLIESVATPLLIIGGAVLVGGALLALIRYRRERW